MIKSLARILLQSYSKFQINFVFNELNAYISYTPYFGTTILLLTEQNLAALHGIRSSMRILFSNSTIIVIITQV